MMYMYGASCLISVLPGHPAPFHPLFSLFPLQDLTPASVTSALHILSSLSDAAAADALFTFLTSHPVSRRISKG